MILSALQLPPIEITQPYTRIVRNDPNSTYIDLQSQNKVLINVINLIKVHKSLENILIRIGF